MNTHKHARLTYVRRIEMVRALTMDGLSTAEVTAAFAVTAPTVRKWMARYRRAAKLRWLTPLPGLEDRQEPSIRPGRC